jgi:hypothetical protein
MHYRIRPGHTFRDSDDSIKGAGEIIELAADTAKLHADKVDLVQAVSVEADVQPSAPAADA